MSRAAPPVVLLLLALLVPLPLNAADRQIALSCVDQAEQLLRLADPAGARRLLRTALEFDPACSDAWYLLSGLLRRSPEDRAEGIAALERAVREDSWDRARGEQARIELAEELILTARPGQALVWLEGIDSASPHQQQVSVLRVRALMVRGERAAAVNLLDSSLKRFPYAVELHTLQARSLLEDRREQEARAGLREAQRLFPRAAEPILLLAALEDHPERRMELVRRYVEVGGRDPGIGLAALGAQGGDSREALELFFRLGGGRRLDLLVELRRALPEEALKGFEEEVTGFTGLRQIDHNGDGWFEERYTWEAGALVGWELDADQDGRPEARVELRFGQPETLLLLGPGSEEVRMRYNFYPYLESVVLKEAGGQREFHLVPFGLSCAALELEGLPPPLGFRIRLDNPSFRPASGLLRGHAYRVDERGPDGRLLRRTALLAGQPLWMEEDGSGDGVPDHLVRYEDGLPVAGSRDVDGDGIFEVREEYREGLPVRLLLDGDGDGRPEYVEELGPRRVQSWDYDGDGRLDRHVILLPDGRRVQEIYRK